MTGAKQFKFCKNCEESKSIDDFYRRSNGYLSAWCKPCTSQAANRKRDEERRLAREARLAQPPPMSRTCTQCGVAKGIDEFYTRQSECKECSRRRRAEYYSRPDVRERKMRQAREYHHANRPIRRIKQLAKYAITPEQYDELFDSCGGKCRICARAGERLGMGSDRRRVLCVDHEHGSGAVRGLLCQTCNRALGLLNDDPKLLRAAAQYLEALSG